MKILFKEEQQFRQLWLWIPLLFFGLFPFYGIYKQIYLGLPFGSKPMSDLGLIIFAIFMTLFLVFFMIMKLTTEIDEEEIRIHFYPIKKKTIKIADIKSAEIVKYSFVGYGIRLGTNFGTIYNVNGNKGLAIELKSGKKLLIGSQNENELEYIIKDKLKVN